MPRRRNYTYNTYNEYDEDDDDDNDSLRNFVMPSYYGSYGASGRKERGLSQRMFLLDATQTSPSSFSFSIEGSRGIPYKIKISTTTGSCTCPDFTGHGRHTHTLCKHLVFLFSRCLRLPENEWGSVFGTKQITIDKFTRLFSTKDVSSNSTTTTTTNGNEETKPNPDEPCPICYEDFKDDPGAVTKMCKTCKNHAHEKCLTVWLRQKQTCPLCRSQWTLQASMLTTSQTGDEFLKFRGLNSSNNSSSSTTTTTTNNNNTTPATTTTTTTTPGSLRNQNLASLNSSRDAELLARLQSEQKAKEAAKKREQAAATKAAGKIKKEKTTTTNKKQKIEKDQSTSSNSQPASKKQKIEKDIGNSSNNTTAIKKKAAAGATAKTTKTQTTTASSSSSSSSSTRQSGRANKGQKRQLNEYV
jgi:hypothetical protein